MPTSRVPRPLKPFKLKPKTDYPNQHDQMMVCRACGKLMRDQEPGSRLGEWFHRPRKGRCRNDNKTFSREDPEIEPFLRKRDRRRIQGIVEVPLTGTRR